MNRLACVFAYLAIAASCRSDRAPAPTASAPSAEEPVQVASPPAADNAPVAAAPADDSAPSPYRSDIENLCEAMARSGADQLPARDRPLTIATWLGAHLQTGEAHQYLVKIQPLTGEAKATALEAEARRVGLTGCALAAEWRTPSTSTSTTARAL